MEEKPPHFRSWKQVYIGVMLFFALLVISFYVFGKVFS